MGRKEHPFVWYYNKELHFAELMNGWLFHGRELLSSDDISSADRRILKRNRRHTYRELYRDLYKSINGTAFCTAQERHADISSCGNTSDPACERAGGTACGDKASSACEGTAGSACKHADGPVCGGAAGSACERANDPAHRCGGEITFRLLTGVEHHDHVHYAMPVRVMDYDCASYSAQKEYISSRHEEAGDLKDDEFLSSFSRTDRLTPVITLVLYCGSSPWDGALRLHELLDLDPLPPELREYVADYRIHVLDVCHTPDERLEEFPPDIRTMFLFIKYKDNPTALMEKLKKAGDVRADTCEAIADIVGERKLKKFMPKEEGGKVSMCKAIQILVEDGELRGEKRGERQGFKRGVAQERKNTESERRRADAERMRAEKAEARIRELEQMLRL